MRFSTGGDPTKSLPLLWRFQEPTNSRKKTGLSVDRIVDTAVEMADADGIGALSMRKVAESLGTGTMSLYTYVPGKGELIDLMLDAALADVHQGEQPEHWRDRLAAIAHANWRLYLRRPWMLQFAQARLLGPNATAKYEAELSAVEGLGLSDLEMDSTVNLVNSYAEGTANHAVSVGETERQSGMTDQQWWQTHGRLLSAFTDDEQYPTASRVGSTVGMARQKLYQPEQEFAFGLERLLDGIQVLVDSRSGTRSHPDSSTEGAAAHS